MGFGGRELGRLYNTTEPFYLHGAGERASTYILMIHGFAGSPSELRRVGYFMNDMGYTVEAIRLPGHGTTPEDMIKTGWIDWTSYVLERYDKIQDKARKRIIVMGHSMGGLLALKLWMERKVNGVVSLAAPVFLTSRKSVLAQWLRYFVKYIEKKPTVAAHLIEEACTYQKMPLKCVVELRKLMKLIKVSMNQINAPVFIGQGEADRIVHPKTAEYLYNHIASGLKQITYYPQTSHAILLDDEWERVYKDIDLFVETVQQLSEAGQEWS
jgi:carboxylesterase